MNERINECIYELLSYHRRSDKKQEGYNKCSEKSMEV